MNEFASFLSSIVKIGGTFAVIWTLLFAAEAKKLAKAGVKGNVDGFVLKGKYEGIGVLTFGMVPLIYLMVTSSIDLFFLSTMSVTLLLMALVCWRLMNSIGLSVCATQDDWRRMRRRTLFHTTWMYCLVIAMLTLLNAVLS